MTEPFLNDIAWCWWTKPRATRIDRTVYLGGLDSSGHMVAATWDLATGTTDRFVLAGFEPDDHNNPALVAEPGKPLVAFYSRHDEDDALRLRISVRPNDISAWHDERVLRFGGATSYAQVHVRGDQLHLLTRVDETTWGYAFSPDWGVTWEPPCELLAFSTDQQIYMPTVLLADGRTLRVAVSGHPKEYEEKPLHDIWVCLVDLDSGAVTRPSDGAVLGNLRNGSGLPLDHHELELIYSCPPDRTVNLFDVSDGPDFEVGFVSKVKDDNTTTDARYHVTAGRDGQWSTEDVVPAGAKFGYIDAGLYVGGLAFPPGSAGGEVFLTREAEGLWYLERWRRLPDATWTPEELLEPSRTRLARPWAVTNPTAGVEVLALALERYSDSSYFHSLSHLVSAGRRGDE